MKVFRENRVFDVETVCCHLIESGDPSSVGIMGCEWRRAAVMVPTPFESNVSTSMGQTVGSIQAGQRGLTGWKACPTYFFTYFFSSPTAPNPTDLSG